MDRSKRVEEALRIGAQILVAVKQAQPANKPPLSDAKEGLAWLFHQRALNRFATILQLCSGGKKDDYEVGVVIGRFLFEMLLTLSYVRKDWAKRLPLLQQFAEWSRYEYWRKRANAFGGTRHADAIRQADWYQQWASQYGTTGSQSLGKRPAWPNGFGKMAEALDKAGGSKRWIRFYQDFYGGASGAAHVTPDWLLLCGSCEPEPQEGAILSPIGARGRRELAYLMARTVQSFLLLVVVTCEELGYDVEQKIVDASRKVAELEGELRWLLSSESM